MSTYHYNLQDDFKDGFSTNILADDIKDSSEINSNLSYINIDVNDIELVFEQILDSNEEKALEIIVENHDIYKFNRVNKIFFDIFQTDLSQKITPGTSVIFTGIDNKVRPCEEGETPNGIVLDVDDIDNGLKGFRKINALNYTPLIEQNDWNVVGLIGIYKVRKDNDLIKNTWIKISGYDSTYDLYTIQ